MWFKHFLIVTACLSLGACGTDFFDSKDEDPPLEGKRIAVLELQSDLKPSENAVPFEAPAPWSNQFWPQAGGYPNHVLQNLALSSEELTRIWSSSIGDGRSDGFPLTAQPVVAAGKVFTLDTEGSLRAFSIDRGRQLWRINITPEDEDDAVIGGGISFSGGYVFATAGYNEVVAIDSNNGDVIWRGNVLAPARAAPTIMNGRVFVSTLNNNVFAFDAESGQVIWEYAGMTQNAGLVGAASPAANSDIVVPAFSSGEIYALQIENGSVAWSDNLSPPQRLGGLSGLTDIRGLPVIDKGLVIAISFGGKMAAIDERSGARVWQRDISGAETPWVAGNFIFVLSNNNALVALHRDTGNINWVKQLPRFRDPDDRKGPIFWTGPVMAGGRLILASSNEWLIEIDPETGETIRSSDTGHSVRIPPIVAGETLYLLSDNGTLLAYQ